jgi:anti-sigma factor (TIGR02949 family)
MMQRLMAYVMRLTGRRTCQDVVAVLHDYLDGSLDAQQANAIERHFQGCPDCDAFVRTYREVVRLTGELASDDIPEEVRQRVRAALRARGARGG